MGKIKKKYNSIKAAAKARRNREIELHGKLISLRASSVHKSKKDYDRKQNKNINLDDS